MNSLKQNLTHRKNLAGKIPLLLLWLIGVPVPVLIVIFLLRGCFGS